MPIRFESEFGEASMPGLIAAVVVSKDGLFATITIEMDGGL